MAYKPKPEDVKAKTVIRDSCEDCHPVTKRINDHHTYKDRSFDTLKEMYKGESNEDQRREIFGEIITRDFQGKEDFLMNELEKANSVEIPYPDKLQSISLLQGLVEFPNNPALKKSVVDILKGKSKLRGGSLTSWGDSIDSLDVLALSIALQVGDLIQDPKVKKAVYDRMERERGYLRDLYFHIRTDEGLCASAPPDFMGYVKKDLELSDVKSTVAK